MEENAIWAIIWLVAAASFGIGELLVAGSFFLLPFAAGALAAAILSALIGPLFGWLGFIVVSIAAFFALRPFAKKLEANAPDTSGIGANRLIGTSGVVLQSISPLKGGDGLVKVGTEKWRADSQDNSQIHEGAKIRVLEVQGTRLIVQTEG